MIISDEAIDIESIERILNLENIIKIQEKKFDDTVTNGELLDELKGENELQPT